MTYAVIAIALMMLADRADNEFGTILLELAACGWIAAAVLTEVGWL